MSEPQSTRQPETEKGLSRKELADRLCLREDDLKKLTARGLKSFPDRTKEHDPDGIGWRYSVKGDRYFPVNI